MSKSLTIAALILSLACGSALAESTGDTLSDNRIKLLPYNESDVYTITTRYGYQTNIVFGTGEEIQTLSVGDRSLWQLIPSSNRLFIRPMEEGVSTNMTVLTNRHAYQFDLKSMPADKKDGNIYVARFTYSDDEPKPRAPIAAPAPTFTPPPVVVAPPPVVQPAPAPTHYSPPQPANTTAPVYPNYNYTYTGPDKFTPHQVYDDGKATYIEFPKEQPLPGVYAVVGGRREALSYSVKGNQMVINSVVGELLLETNGGDVHIYNETMNPR